MNSLCSEEWKVVKNVKKEKRRSRLEERRREQEIWGTILVDCPHVVTPSRAKKLQHMLNIDKLESRLLSKDWIDYQTKGWKYVKTLKKQKHGQETLEKRPGYEYSILELENGWGDRVLFCRVQEENNFELQEQLQ